MAKDKKDIQKETKVFNDPIHGHMDLHPLLVRIINTPQFQRLRNIKQLGGAYFVYPGASHNRFEHSIGVGYLAGELAKALKTEQPELNITDQDVLCVQIVGLCHDLGHGPFSHLYDGLFIPEAKKADKVGKPNAEWKHEEASLKMFHYLLDQNNLKQDLNELYGLNTNGKEENDLVFIEEMINGPKKKDEEQSLPTMSSQDTSWPYAGRRKEKSFLYDIVSNKETGIDVDKFDYFARDCYHLGFQSNFDHKRFIMFARVCDVKGKKYICSRDKEAANLYDIFHTRHTIHRRACQHRVTKGVEIMIKDALLKANDEIKIEGSKGKLFSLSEARYDMEAYTKLTDQVLEEIYKSTSDSLKEAREIIQRIMTRKLYWCVGQAKPKMDQNKILEEMMESLKKKLAEALPLAGDQDENQNKTIEMLKKELSEAIPKEGNQNEKGTFQVTFMKKDQENILDKKKSLKRKLEADMPGIKFEVIVVTMDYGMKDKDPINNTYFYRKNEPNKGFTIPKSKVSKLLPECFSEEILRVYLKDRDDKHIKKAETCFKDWCKENDFEVDREDDDDDASAGSCAIAVTDQ